MMNKEIQTIPNLDFDFQFKRILLKIDEIEGLISANKKQEIPALLTMQQTADMLNISMRTLSELIKDNDFPNVIKIGRQNRFKISDITDYIEKMSINHKKN